MTEPTKWEPVSYWKTPFPWITLPWLLLWALFFMFSCERRANEPAHPGSQSTNNQTRDR